LKTNSILAVGLIILGVVVLAYSGISFNTPGKPVEFLGIRIATTDRHFIPPVVGLVALIGGVGLLVMSSRKA